MREIPLTQGYVALVDDADFDWLNQWKWCAKKDHSTIYVHRTAGTRPYRSTVRMHQVIAGNGTDHRDGNGLNNQRYNLRAATQTQSNQNRGLRSDNTTGVIGVSRKHGKYAAHIKVHGKQKSVGLFVKLEDAAAARLAGEIQYHGEFSAALSRAA